MVKFFITSLIFLLGYFVVLGGEVDKDLHQKCLYPTIQVGNAAFTSYGSGVVIRSEKIEENLYKNAFITCGHLAENTNDYAVKFFIYENWSNIKSTKVYPAVFYGHHKTFDVAVGFFYSDQEMPVAKLDFSPRIFIGNEVFRIGCGMGDEPRLDYGKITSLAKPTLARPIRYRTSVYTVPGDSGSPLFHENKVIAIMVSIRVRQKSLLHSISYAVPIDRFQAWDKNLDFIWDETKPMPSMPFYYLNFKTATPDQD